MRVPSFHDNYLVSYTVGCEARAVTLLVRREFPAEHREERAVLFTGVVGYDFSNDAFGNIIFSLEETSVKQLLSEYGAQIAESYRKAGAPGPWAADLASAGNALAAQGMRAFVLSSSYGLSGWVLAENVEVVHPPQN